MPRVRMAIGAVTLTLALAGSASAFSVSYDQAIASPQGTFKSSVVVKDEMFRIEMTVAGTKTIVIRNRNGTYQYVPDQRMAFPMPATGPGQGPIEGAKDYTGYLTAHQATRVRSESLHGVMCDVYEFTDPSMGGAATAWVSTDQPLPVRLELQTAQGKTVTEYSNVRLNPAVSESAFELPAGTEIMDAGAMMQELMGQGF